MLIAQDRAYIEYNARQVDGRWLFTEYHGLITTIHVDAIGCELSLADIYEKVELEPSMSGDSVQNG